MSGLLLALSTVANWIPDPTPEWRTSPKPYVVLMLLGFFVAIAGHIIKARFAVALGIALIFLACALLPFATFVSKSQ